MRTWIKKSSRTTLLKVLGSLFSLILFLWLLGQQGWDPILASVRQVGLESIGLALVFILLSRLAIAARWHVILRGVAAQISMRETFKLTFAGLFASNFLPSTIGGDIVRLAGGLRVGLDYAKCTASLVVDRLIGMAGMLIPLPIGLAALSGAVPPASRLEPGLLAGFAGLQRFDGEVKTKISKILLEPISALTLWIGRPGALLISFGLSLLHMVGVFSAVGIILRSMDQPFAFARIAGLWSLIYFVTLLPISVNGLGLQEISLSYVFGTLGGIPLESALSLALILRTLLVAASLPGALFVPGLIGSQVDGPSPEPVSPERAIDPIH